jgi:hypothetical protein
MGKAQAERVSFLAIIPPDIQAIKFNGQDGCRLTLDVDGASEEDMYPLLRMRREECVLRVTIEKAE